MKIFLLTFTALIILTTTFAQNSNSFKYQAVVRDANDNVIENKVVGFRISFLKGSTYGETVYSEEHSPTTNEFGLVILDIGNGETYYDFMGINWSNDIYFLQIELNVDNKGYKIMGTSQMQSVPYAIHAKTADSVLNLDINDDDANPTNELITDIKLDGTMLVITEAENHIKEIDLSSLVLNNKTKEETVLKNLILEGDTLKLVDTRDTTEVDLSSLKGKDGIQGEVGEKGEQGEQGVQGEKGEQGEQGIQGEVGEEGEQGGQGIQGEQGVQGIQGESVENAATKEYVDLLATTLQDQISTLQNQIITLQNQIDNFGGSIESKKNKGKNEGNGKK